MQREDRDSRFYRCKDWKNEEIVVNTERCTVQIGVKGEETGVVGGMQAA